MNDIDLNDQLWRIVDDALSTSNSRITNYGEIAYKQGYEDAIDCIKKVSNI